MTDNQDVPDGSADGNISIMLLSDEVLLMIIEFLPGEDKITLTKVCRRFNRVLYDKKLCEHFKLSPKQDQSCLKYLGEFIKYRRTHMKYVDINSCDWIPMPKFILLTKSLSNLYSLRVLNISVSVVMLSKILKDSKQLRELAWSWRGEDKTKDITWSAVPPEDRSTLTTLERLFICIPDAGSGAVYEFLLDICINLTHLTIQVDPALGSLQVTRSTERRRVPGPKNLRYLVAYEITYDDHSALYSSLESGFRLRRLIAVLFEEIGGPNCDWECFWTSSYPRCSWSIDQRGGIFISNNKKLKSFVVHLQDFMNVEVNLSIENLVVEIPFHQFRLNIPSLHLVAPNLRKLAVMVGKSTTELITWTISSLHMLPNLVEVNVHGMHFCDHTDRLESFWSGITSLNNLKKLAISPCLIPKCDKLKSGVWDKSKFIVASTTNVSEVLEELSEELTLRSLEELEIGQLGFRETQFNVNLPCAQIGWFPFLPVLSLWTNLAHMTLDSLASIRNFCHFILIAKKCTNLRSLKLRHVGPSGLSAYLKDIANAIPFCHELRHFRLEQSHASDFYERLLEGLTSCTKLESVCITNFRVVEKSHLNLKQCILPLLLKMLNNNPSLWFLQIPLVDTYRKGCVKVKKWLEKRLTPSRRNHLVMEFCSVPQLIEGFYHAFPKDVPRLEYMAWRSNVVVTPPNWWTHNT